MPDSEFFLRAKKYNEEKIKTKPNMVVLEFGRGVSHFSTGAGAPDYRPADLSTTSVYLDSVGGRRSLPCGPFRPSVALVRVKGGGGGGVSHSPARTRAAPGPAVAHHCETPSARRPGSGRSSKSQASSRNRVAHSPQSPTNQPTNQPRDTAQTRTCGQRRARTRLLLEGICIIYIV